MKKMIMVVMMVVMTGIFYSSMAHAEAEYACYESSHDGMITGDGWVAVSENLELLDAAVAGGMVFLVQVDGQYYIKVCNDPAGMGNFFKSLGVSLTGVSVLMSDASAFQIAQLNYDGVFVIRKTSEGKYGVLTLKVAKAL